VVDIRVSAYLELRQPIAPAKGMDAPDEHDKCQYAEERGHAPHGQDHPANAGAANAVILLTAAVVENADPTPARDDR